MTLKYNPLLGTGLDNIGSTSTEKARYINFVVGTASDPNASTFDYTTDGTADEVQINAALAALPSAGGSVLIRAGSYTIADSILCPSNSTLFIGDGVTIKPVNNFAPTSTTVDGNVVRAFIRNSDHASGNTNIRIVGPGLVSASGVTLGTNVANEPCYVGIMFNKTTFSKVEGLRISDIMYGEGSAEINTPTVVRQYGVFFAESNDCDVIDCTISRINNDSVSIRRNSNRCKVDRCNLSYSHLGHAAGQDGSGAALIFGDNGTGRAYGNQWTNNTVLGDAAYATTAIGGIVTHGNVDSLISNNTIIDCGVGIGFVGDCERCLASDNVIVDPRFKGIWLRTDASGSNFYNELKGNKIKMHSSCPIGIYLESSTAGLSVTGASISDNHILGADAVGGSGTQVGIQMDTSTSTGLLQDIIIKDNHIYLCGQAGIYVDTLTSGAIAQRIFISGGHIRNCGYGIELGRTSSGTLTIGTINDISISSSRTQIGSSGISPRGIQWLAASFYTVTAGRIRVNGIAIRETASTSSANRISFCDTTSSGTVAPELYGSSSRASGYDYGYTGGTGDIVFSVAPNFTGPVTVGGLTSIATNGGVDIASGGIGLVVGADGGATTRTDVTAKAGRIGGPHYTNSEEPVSGLIIGSDSTSNNIAIGGGNSLFNAATSFQVYTAANNTTTTGTLRMIVNSSGLVGINTSSPISTSGGLDVSSGAISLVIGADTLATTRTNATTKFCSIASPHYTNSEEPVGLIVQASSAAENALAIGGASTLFNAATSISFSTAANNTTTIGSTRMYINSSGLVGISTTSPITTSGGLDVSSGGIGLIVGADNAATSRTNVTNKVGLIGSPHYTNAEEPVCLVTSSSTATTNDVSIGGSSSSLNAATSLNFYTAANATTTTGTQRLLIDTNGLVGVNTTSPISTSGGLDISSGGMSLVIGADSAATSRTNATNKIARFASPHYTNSEEPTLICATSNTTSANSILIGGGSATNNAATSISFYTAANNTTTTGTSRMSIDSAGAVVAASTFEALTLKTGAPAAAAAGAFKLGVVTSATVALDTTRYIPIEIGGTAYKILVST